MDLRVQEIFETRDNKKRLVRLSKMMEMKLYSIEYLDDIKDKFKSIITNKIVTTVNEMYFACERIEDSKLVHLYKLNARDYATYGHQYAIHIPIELSDEEYNELLDADEGRYNNKMSDYLRGFAIICYIFAAITGVIGLALAAEESGFYFIPVLGSVLFLVFLGMVVHGLAHILDNVVSINRKIK